MSDKITERIAQLLAKAESTTPHEAEALTEAAEKLMVKYGIQQAMIDAKRANAGQPSEEIIQMTITFKGAYRLELVRLGTAVCRGLGALRNMMSTYKNSQATLYIIGYKSDVEQAVTLINSLQVQSVVALRDWWKTNKDRYQWETSYNQEAARRSFVDGFGSGAGRRIADSRRQILNEEPTAGTELVLVSRDDKVQEYFSQISTRASRARGGKSDYSARTSGYAAGQQANTGGKAVGHRKGISA